MDIQKRITRQRVNHIIDSYQLDGSDGEAFTDFLDNLLEIYPQALIELALTEAIVKAWSEVPMQKGMPFIKGVHDQLRCWQPDLEPSAQLPGCFTSARPKTSLGATSLDVKAVNPSPIDPESINTSLTPAQFEQITGLDADLVFNEDGNVLTTKASGKIKPLEPR